MLRNALLAYTFFVKSTYSCISRREKYAKVKFRPRKYKFIDLDFTRRHRTSCALACHKHLMLLLPSRVLLAVSQRSPRWKKSRSETHRQDRMSQRPESSTSRNRASALCCTLRILHTKRHPTMTKKKTPLTGQKTTDHQQSFEKKKIDKSRPGRTDNNASSRPGSTSATDGRLQPSARDFAFFTPTTYARARTQGATRRTAQCSTRARGYIMARANGGGPRSAVSGGELRARDLAPAPCDRPRLCLPILLLLQLRIFVLLLLRSPPSAHWWPPGGEGKRARGSDVV